MTGAVAFPSMFSLDGQTALVIGGSRGIGQAMAMALAEASANILLVQVWAALETSAENLMLSID